MLALSRMIRMTSQAGAMSESRLISGTFYNVSCLSTSTTVIQLVNANTVSKPPLEYFVSYIDMLFVPISVFWLVFLCFFVYMYYLFSLLSCGVVGRPSIGNNVNLPVFSHRNLLFCSYILQMRMAKSELFLYLLLAIS